MKYKTPNDLLGSAYLPKTGVCRGYRTLNLFLLFTVVQFGLMVGVGNMAGAATLWVANSSSETITELSMNGHSLGNYAIDCNPDSIAIGKSGSIWVACHDSNFVTKLSPSGRKLGEYSIGNTGARAVAASKNIWVAIAPRGGGFGTPPTGDSYVTELNSWGKDIRTFSASISYPNDIAIDRSKDVWVANLNNVTELDPDGRVIGKFAAGPRPSDIAIDALGHAWVLNTDPANGRGSVVEINPLGKQIGVFTTGYYPLAIAIGNNGNIWIANDGNGKPGVASGDSNVTELDHNGKIIGTFVAGSFPWAIAIDGNDNVYVVNNKNHGTVTELNPMGNKIGVYSVGSKPEAIAIDGN
ncbi:NHL repeat-containing protein [Acidithiobacillus sulfuriphilus]|uniref:NHL repeat-containing protein n=1 Tax=Acidithiobacillus sulfuriphilus TaxID=1867749 RepID=UPI003F606E37